MRRVLLSAGLISAFMASPVALAENPSPRMVDDAGRACSRGGGDPLRHPCLPSTTPMVGGFSTISAPVNSCVSIFSDVLPPRSTNAPRDSFLCPLSSQFRTLDPRYPPSAIFVNYLPPTRGFPGNGAFIADLVTRMQALSPNTRINVMAPSGSLPVRSGTPPREVTALSGNADVRMIETDAGVSLWAQDTHEFGVIDGKPAILDLPTDRARGNHIPRAIADACSGSRMEYVPEPCLVHTRIEEPVGDCYDDLMDLANTRRTGAANIARRDTLATRIRREFPACSAQLDQLYTESGHMPSIDASCCPSAPSTSDDDFGGNIEALPGGRMMIGAGANRGIREFLRDQNRGREPVQIHSEFLAVGHIDEVFSIVPTSNPAPCNFALAYNSPALGLRTLESRPGAERVGHRDVEPEGPKTVAQLRTNRDFVASNMLISRQIEKDRDELLDSMRLPSDHPSSGCANIPTIEVPSLFRSSMWRRSEINAQVPSTLAIDEMKTRIAGLSGADLDAAMGSLSGMSGSDFESVLPNMVNGISVGANTITPDPRYSPFQTAMDANMRAAGVTPQFMQDTLYHNGMGEIHCGTNIVRACSELMENPFTDEP